MRFHFRRLRFHFEAIDPVNFPHGQCGNMVRGAFGRSFRASCCVTDCQDSKRCTRPCVYRATFEPRREGGNSGAAPSGFADPPRPFVIRAWEFDGITIEAGGRFWFDLHLFDVSAVVAHYQAAFARLALDGFGRGRSRVRLVESTVEEPQSLDLGTPLEDDSSVRRIAVEFRTPTELKADGRTLGAAPEFAVLVSRARDRISGLRALYGEGPLALDFKGFAERAGGISLADSAVVHHAIARTSGRTGQRHSIGGFTGTVLYEGEGLAEFLPFLDAAQWTGVGRQTVWGKGEIKVSRLA